MSWIASQLWRAYALPNTKVEEAGLFYSMGILSKSWFISILKL